MRRIALLIFGLAIAFTSFSQVNGNFRSVRLLSADSSQGTLNGTMYYGANGFRFRQAGVWYPLSSLINPALTASNGLTKVGNDFRLGGTIETSALIEGAGSLTVNLSGDINFSTDNDFNLYGGESLNLESGNTGIFSLSKHFFTPTPTLSGYNWGSVTVDPSSLVDGDSWYRSDLDIYRGRANGATISFGTGTIGGTLASTQVGYGSGSNTMTSEAAFNYNAATNKLAVDYINANGTEISFGGGGAGTMEVSAITGGLILSGGTTAELTAATQVSITAGTDLVITSGSGDVYLTAVPDLNNSTTQILGRNSATGKLERADASLFSPGGSNGQVQFNNSGAFGGDADLTYAPGSNVLTVGDPITTNATEIDDTGITMSGSGGSPAINISPSGTTNGVIGVNGTLVVDSDGSMTFTVNNAANPIILSNGSGSNPLRLIFQNIPTSSAGLTTGMVWSNSNVLTIVP
jgi:hypothetical protein